MQNGPMFFFFVIMMSHMHKIYTKVDHDRTETMGLCRETDFFKIYYRICLGYSFRKRVVQHNTCITIIYLCRLHTCLMWLWKKTTYRFWTNKPHVVTIFAKNIISLLIEVSLFLFIICLVINTVFMHNYVIQMTSQN